MPSSLWFSPVCDDLLKRILIWVAMYEQGEVHTTREWVSPIDGSVIDKPTKYAHKIPWKESELGHLVRIMQEHDPKLPLTGDLEKVHRMWRSGQMMTGGYRVLTLIFYKADLEDILKVLYKAKHGEPDLAIEAQPGKEMFQL